jgi:hypothetical protein
MDRPMTRCLLRTAAAALLLAPALAAAAEPTVALPQPLRSGLRLEYAS